MWCMAAFQNVSRTISNWLVNNLDYNNRSPKSVHKSLKKKNSVGFEHHVQIHFQNVLKNAHKDDFLIHLQNWCSSTRFKIL